MYAPNNDLGKLVYHREGEKAVQISLPHILQVNITQPPPAPGIFNVRLFGANTNYLVPNFGNNVAVTVTYIGGNPLVPFTYEDLLGTFFGEAMQIGITRVDAVTIGQAQQQISVIYNPGVSKFEGESLFPLVYPDQFASNIVYVEKAYKIDNNVQLNYLHNGQTNPAVQFRFYQHSNITLDRAFSNQPLIKQYAMPPKGITSQTQIINTKVTEAPRSSVLL